MNHHERRRYDMFIRVAQFGADNAADFPPGSVGATQFAEVGAVVTRLQELLGDQSEGFSDARFEYQNKDTARENLREEIVDINRTARSMVYLVPGIDTMFRMPRNATDADLLAVGRAFHQNSEQYNDQFVEYGLPANFRNELQAAIDAFEASLATPGTAVDEQVAATAEIGSVVKRGMRAVRILKGVVKNKYRNNVGKLAAWLSASHIEKAPKKEAQPVA